MRRSPRDAPVRDKFKDTVQLRLCAPRMFEGLYPDGKAYHDHFTQAG
jgi:hypothetical protein